MTKRKRTPRDLKFEKLVGDKIRTRRNLLGWAQQYLADQSGVDKSVVQRVENSKNSPSLAVIVAIGKGLGLQPFELLRIDHQVKVNSQLGPQPKKKLTGIKDAILSVVKSNFLLTARSVGEVVSQCNQKQKLKVSSSAVSAILKELVIKHEIKRIPSKIKSRFLYQKLG